MKQNKDKVSNSTSEEKVEQLSQSLKPTTKTNYPKTFLLVIGFIGVFVVGGISGYIFGLRVKTSNVQLRTESTVQPTIQPQPTDAVKTDDNVPAYAPLTLLSLTESENLEFERTYNIRWKDVDLEKWGNEVIICLIGFNLEGDEIPAKKEWNEQLCTYRSGNLSGSYLITITKLSDGVYEWIIPSDIYQRFESKPTKFKIRLLVFDNLPSEGRTEWAGNVGWDESKDYLSIAD